MGVDDSRLFPRMMSQGSAASLFGEDRKICVDKLPTFWPTCGGQCGPFYFLMGGT